LFPANAQTLKYASAVKGIHTRSKYQMQLIIAYGVDVNNNGVPLAWALVPIEDE
jgi:hypothetical protein